MSMERWRDKRFWLALGLLLGLHFCFPGTALSSPLDASVYCMDAWSADEEGDCDDHGRLYAASSLALSFLGHRHQCVEAYAAALGEERPGCALLPSCGLFPAAP